MASNNTGIFISFHNRANESFFQVEQEFLAATASLNREREEYRFQQAKKDYANALKQQLEMYAQELLHTNGLHPATGQVFTDLINDYLHRFLQKINAY